MIKSLFSYFLLSLPLLLTAQTRKYSNEFLQIGVGSRAFGMAGSVVASTSDVSSGYWNPAGLMNMKSQSQASLMHSEYFSGIAKYDYAGFSTFIADNTAVVGASIVRFGVDDIPDTSELIDASGDINYDRVKSFSAADYAFLFSYARRRKKADENGLSYGANVKIIHRKVGEYGKSWGFGIDVGAQYKHKKFTFAAVGRDITTTFNAWSYNPDKFSSIYTATGNDIPNNSTETTLPRIILGTAYETKINDKFGILGEVNLNLTTDGKRNVLVAADPVSVDPTVGLEGNFKKLIFLRAGVGNIQKITDFNGTQQYEFQPNFGLGLKIENFSIDYALTNAGSGLYSNVFSLRLDFDKK